MSEMGEIFNAIRDHKKALRAKYGGFLSALRRGSATRTRIDFTAPTTLPCGWLC
jgi:hypothetical protein